MGPYSEMREVHYNLSNKYTHLWVDKIEVAGEVVASVES